MITSSSNTRMKYIIQLNKKARTRRQERVFVVEGIKMCLEAPREQIQEMYVSESFLADHCNQERLQGFAYEIVSDGVFSKISDTMTPQGILCLVRMPQYRLEDLLGEDSGRCRTGSFPGKADSYGQEAGQNAPHLLILENIQDPGNLGTRMRAGEGAGVTGVIMDGTTVDIFNPKTIRSTMGSLFRVPFYVADNLSETIGVLKESGVLLYAACLDGAQLYDKPDYTLPCGFMIGNEANGLRAETAALADIRIRIPMQGKVESLNAAVASALLMYEASRQHR